MDDLTSPPGLSRLRVLWQLDRAISGARQCKQRLAAAKLAASRIPIRRRNELIDRRGERTNDDYAFDAVRVDNIARRVLKAQGPSSEAVAEARAYLKDVAPQLRSFRNASSDADEPDGRLVDVAFFSEAVRLLPNGDVKYLVDPDSVHHVALERLYEATRSALTQD